MIDRKKMNDKNDRYKMITGDGKNEIPESEDMYVDSVVKFVE